MLLIAHLLYILFWSFLLNSTNAAKILGVFYFPSISHQVVYQPIWKELSLRGHQVTILTPNPLNNPNLTNLTEINLNSSYRILHDHNLLDGMDTKKFSIKIALFIGQIMQKIISHQLENEEVQKLLNDNKANFDLILIEALNPIYFGFSYKYNAPTIGFSSLGVLLNTHDSVGNPTHPIISPDIILTTSKNPTFFEIVQSTLYNFYYRIVYHNYILPKFDAIARKHFGEDMPYLGDLENSVSLLMLNANPLLHNIRPNVPAIIELGQMHIRPKQRLPKHLKNFLNSATNGVIYFSLGTNIEFESLSENLRNVIIGALSELPFKVLCKCETDYLPNRLKNVFTQKWFPQQDILGHPNIKAFITQGGLQSMEEAIVNGVPLIGIPFFVDQPLNVEKMVEMGIAKRIDHNTVSKDILRDTIIEVATNETYRKNVERIRDLLKDKPMTGLQSAIWWIEYVIRHNGASHLRCKAADMPWYEYYLIHVWIFIIFVTTFIFYCLHFIIINSYLLLRIMRGKEKLKTT